MLHLFMHLMYFALIYSVLFYGKYCDDEIEH